MDYKEKAEGIVGDLMAETNPVDIKTGEKVCPSEEVFTNAWDKAVRRIVELAQGKK